MTIAMLLKATVEAAARVECLGELAHDSYQVAGLGNSACLRYSEPVGFPEGTGLPEGREGVFPGGTFHAVGKGSQGQGCIELGGEFCSTIAKSTQFLATAVNSTSRESVWVRVQFRSLARISGSSQLLSSQIQVCCCRPRGSARPGEFGPPRVSAPRGMWRAGAGQAGAAGRQRPEGGTRQGAGHRRAGADCAVSPAWPPALPSLFGSAFSGLPGGRDSSKQYPFPLALIVCPGKEKDIDERCCICIYIR